MNNSKEPRPGLNIQVSHHISWKDIDALLITAFEGGSNYWLSKVTPMNGDHVISWESQFDWEDSQSCPMGTEDLKGMGLHYVIPIAEGNSISLMEDDEGGNKVTVINESDVRTGLEIMAKKYARHWKDVVDDNHDADTADVFLQCCIFREIVYG